MGLEDVLRWCRSQSVSHLCDCPVALTCCVCYLKSANVDTSVQGVVYLPMACLNLTELQDVVGQFQHACFFLGEQCSHHAAQSRGDP